MLNKIITIKINSKIIENETAINIFNKDKIPLRHLLNTINKLSSSENKIILIVVDTLNHIGWALIQNIRRALLPLNKSNKVIAYLERGGMKEYYTASVASEIIMPPASSLELIGLGIDVFFIKKALSIIGLEPDFIKTGAYKTFADMFMRNSISREHKQMLNTIINTYIKELDSHILKSRPNMDKLSNLIDKGPFTANEAIDNNIIDHLMYEEEIEDYFKERFKLKKCIKIPLKISDSYFNLKKLFLPIKKIALIYAEGIIIEEESRKSHHSHKDYIAPHSLCQSIRKARENKSIRGVVIRINSPGGSALASDIIWHEIRKTRNKKPVVVSMSNTAASGGYYIAMASDCIFAETMTLTGSIGVVMGKLSGKSLLKTIGVRRDSVNKGKNIDILSPFSPFSHDNKAKLEKQITSFYYKQFLDKTAQCRNKSVDSIAKTAEGRVWTGYNAKENGLVDKIGGLMEAIEHIRTLANIKKNDNLKIAVYHKKKFKLSIMSALRNSIYPFSSQINSILNWKELLFTEKVLYLDSHIFKVK